MLCLPTNSISSKATRVCCCSTGDLPIKHVTSAQLVVIHDQFSNTMQLLLLLLQVIPHGHQDVNRLHLMPQNPNLVATCSDDPQVRIYDLSRNTPAQHPTQRSGSRSPRLLSAADHDLDHNLDHDHDLDLDPDHPPEQTAVLGGRSAGGFGLEWNPVHEGLLLGADVQGSVQIWDVGSSSSSSTKGAVIEPVWVSIRFGVVWASVDWPVSVCLSWWWGLGGRETVIAW